MKRPTKRTKASKGAAALRLRRSMRAVKLAPKAEARAFLEGLVQRGEAVVLRKGKALPSGATHKVLGYSPKGLPIVKRQRLSAV